MAAPSSFHPMMAAVAAVTRPPTRIIAPMTCTKSAMLMLSERISGSRLVDHVEDDQDEQGDRREVQQWTRGRAKAGEHLGLVGAPGLLPELLHPHVVGARALADPAGRDQQDDRGDDPAVPEIEPVRVERED